MTSSLPDAQRIGDQLTPSTIFRRIEVVEETGSTNADLAERARRGEGEGVARVAMTQTAGRGRLDRRWISPLGSSISLSVLLAPKPQLPQWGWLSILAGMSVAGALADLAPQASEVLLKWPNDVLISGRKVCGILSERIESPTGPRAVVGIGINVTLTEEELPVPHATSLALAGFPTDQSTIVAGVLNHFDRYYAAWRLSGSLRAEYEQRCASIGAELTVVVDEQHRVHGVGRGIDQFGRLQVATPSGIQTFAVGDVVHARLA